MTEAGADFLGVARSLRGLKWRRRPADPTLIRELELRHTLSEPLARALCARGVTLDEAADFLRPTLKALFPDPSTFVDMDLAARILVDALETRRPTVIFADYDVDGAASAAQIVRWFRRLGVEIPIYVPDRLEEGYGPSPAAFRRIRAGGAELVITVDCGASAADAFAAAADIGLEVVVIDHHPVRAGRPAVAAMVNPNRWDCASGQGLLAAAGVTFVLLAALNREARRRGLFAAVPEPDLRQWLDLAALGAICDVTRLVGFNRALTARGLQALCDWRNPGLDALRDVAGATREAPGVFEAGFILGPRINAGGRIGRADLGARLLSTDDPAEARALALELDALNARRRDVERAIFEEAVVAIEHDSNFDPDAPALVVAREGWHPGVVGIVASRLRERYGKPVVVAGIDRAADIARGSGRSQPGMDLGAAICAALDGGLLLSGGGHAMAAGVTLRPSAIPELRAFLCAQLRAESLLAPREEVLIDALVSCGEGARACLDAFAVLAPHGPGNPEPVVALADVRIAAPAPMRGGHVRCSLADVDGGRLGAVAWRVADTPLGARLMSGAGAVHVAGRLKRNSWQGRERVELDIDDLAEARPPAPC